MFTIEIPTNTLKILNRVASTDETRSVICGVHLEATCKGGILLVATDGRRIAILEIKEPSVDDFQFTIPSAFIEALPANYKTELSYGPETGEIQAKCEGFNVHTVAIESRVQGRYPKWRQVVPSPWPKTLGNRSIAVNMAYLAGMCAIAEELSDRDTAHGVTITSNGDDRDPICVRRHNFTAVVMPLTNGQTEPPAFTL